MKKFNEEKGRKGSEKGSRKIMDKRMKGRFLSRNFYFEIKVIYLILYCMSMKS